MVTVNFGRVILKRPFDKRLKCHRSASDTISWSGATSRDCYIKISICMIRFGTVIMTFKKLQVHKDKTVSSGYENTNCLKLLSGISLNIAFLLIVHAPALWTWMDSACDICGAQVSGLCCGSLRQWKPTTQRPWHSSWLCELLVFSLSCGHLFHPSLMRTHGASLWFMVGRIIWAQEALWNLLKNSTFLTFLVETAM